MSLRRHNVVRMDLAAFRLGEVEQVRPGVFRHRASLAALLERVGRAITTHPLIAGVLRLRASEGEVR